jgi:hypothetical protein
MDPYSSLLLQYEKSKSELNKKERTIITMRVGVILLLILSFILIFKLENKLFFIPIAICILIFIFLYKKHKNLVSEITINSNLISINKEEINFLSHNDMPWDNGNNFIDVHHPYTYDLDIFGKNSLYHHLNRCSTYFGMQSLASFLTKKFNISEILQNQNAIKELKEKLQFRQYILAVNKSNNIKQNIDQILRKWIDGESSSISKILNAISFISPALLILTLFLNYFFDLAYLNNIATYIFLFNLLTVFGKVKLIQKEIQTFEKIHLELNQFSSMLNAIQNEPFKNDKLIQLQKKLQIDGISASQSILQLSNRISNLDTINNLPAAILMNGFFLYHIHEFRKLLEWKSKYDKYILIWFEVLGDIEALNSFANFSFNNPEYAYPSLNSNNEIIFRNLKHPLLNKKNSVGNDVSLHKNQFILLSGSNMSGKSTYLRAIGINMVLGSIGAPVCSDEANICPLRIMVSMRLADSLSDSESYFFAELKRLKMITEVLDKEACLILLDEILRGTNSDDKRNGTIGVIKKLIKKDGIGLIATHDLEVCQIAEEHPEQLINKCFEAEIINDELVFDYKLRDGICKNKNATFLMKKMNVI